MWINGVYFNANDANDPNNLKFGVAYSKDAGSTWNWSFPGEGMADIASISMFDALHGFAISDFLRDTVTSSAQLF